MTLELDEADREQDGHRIVEARLDLQRVDEARGDREPAQRREHGGVGRLFGWPVARHSARHVTL